MSARPARLYNSCILQDFAPMGHVWTMHLRHFLYPDTVEQPALDLQPRQSLAGPVKLPSSCHTTVYLVFCLFGATWKTFVVPDPGTIVRVFLCVVPLCRRKWVSQSGWPLQARSSSSTASLPPEGAQYSSQPVCKFVYDDNILLLLALVVCLSPKTRQTVSQPATHRSWRERHRHEVLGRE